MSSVRQPQQRRFAPLRTQFVGKLLTVLGFHHGVASAVHQQKGRFVAIDKIHRLRPRPKRL